MLVLLDNLGDVPYTRRLFKSSLSDARKRLSHKRKGPVVDRRKATVVDRRCPGSQRGSFLVPASLHYAG